MEDSMIIRHQNYMWAVREGLGWPPFKPANDCVAFVTGRTMDHQLGMDLVRHAQTAHKDLIYTGWANADADTPEGITVVLRELLSVDVMDRCFLWAPDQTSPLVIVSTRSDESFIIGRRGLLERIYGKPKNLTKGRKLAAQRVGRAAARKGNELCERNSWVANGAQWIEPASLPQETVVRFN